MKLLSSIKTITAASLVALPMLAFAAVNNMVWDPAHNPLTTGKWTEGDNWHSFPADTWGTAPLTADDKAVFNAGSTIPCVIDTAVTPAQMVIGDNGLGGSVIITNGGALNPSTVDWTGVGYNNEAYLEVQSGGSMTCPDHLWIGLLAPLVGTFVMKGGTVTVNGQLGLGFEGGTATAHIDGGTLNLHNFIAGPGVNHVAINDTSTMDIAGGTVIINGDKTAAVNAYIAAGRITGYGGTGTVNATYDGGTDKTTVTASGGSGGTAAHINSISVSGGNVTIKYSTAASTTYHVETSSTLPASWSTVAGTTITGSGAEQTATFAVGGNAQFYRVVSP